MPISLVRSVTETNMMFITTMPPTSREIDAIPIVTAKNARLMFDQIWRKFWFVPIEKSSFAL